MSFPLLPSTSTPPSRYIWVECQGYMRNVKNGSIIDHEVWFIASYKEIAKKATVDNTATPLPCKTCGWDSKVNGKHFSFSGGKGKMLAIMCRTCKYLDNRNDPYTKTVTFNQIQKATEFLSCQYWWRCWCPLFSPSETNRQAYCAWFCIRVRSWGIF